MKKKELANKAKETLREMEITSEEMCTLYQLGETEKYLQQEAHFKAEKTKLKRILRKFDKATIKELYGVFCKVSIKGFKERVSGVIVCSDKITLKKGDKVAIDLTYIFICGEGEFKAVVKGKS